MRPFHYPWLWLAIGWVGIGLLITLSLVSVTVTTTLIAYEDKLFHLLTYALLMSWFIQLYQNWKLILLHATGLVLLGVALEFIQPLNGRHFEYADMAANTLGVLTGCLLALTPLRDRLLWIEKQFTR
jgi:hypothetical protein